MGNISIKNGIGIRTFQKQRLRPGYWVDTRRFVSRTNREFANGLFEVFGDFCNEPAGTVRDNLMGWIYDNFRDVEQWTHLMLKEKEVTLSGWIENMCKETTPGDDICLYLLSRMYNKHIYVHNKRFYWCTALHVIKNEVDLELIKDCNVELVFVHPWVFGEVKKVRVPRVTLPSKSTMSLKTVKADTSITENTKADQAQETKDCTVTLTWIKEVQADNRPNPPTEETGQTRHTRRKSTVTDYNKLINYDDDDDIGGKLQPSPKKQKKWLINLLRKPSRTRQRIERNRQINKEKKAPEGNKYCADSQSSTGRPIGTSPSVSDSMSPNAQPIESPIKVLTKTGKQRKRRNKTPEIKEPTNRAETSKNTPPDKQSDQQDTVLVLATNDETKIAIDALLSLGNDLNIGAQMDPTDNELLQLIAPRNTLPDPSPMVAEADSDDTEILDEIGAPPTDNKPVAPAPKDMSDKQRKIKGQLVVQSFQLARNYKPKCRFSCVECSQKFAMNRELNDHFRSSHAPLTCSDCKKLFLTPSAFEKHKYIHYEFMYECETCSKGFHFQSKLSMHRRKHIADHGLVCFHAKCGKRFKHSSKLKVHLKNHTGKPIKCDHCMYTKKDIRNVRAHARVHTDIQNFVCVKCRKRFKWGSQKKRDLDSGKCPG